MSRRMISRLRLVAVALGVGGAQFLSLVTASPALAATPNTWEQLAAVPGSPEGGASATGHDGRIYFVGGFQESTARTYHPGTNTWTTIGSMTTARWGAAAATGPNGRIYVIGGMDQDSSILASVEAYDPGTDSWSLVAPMPTARMWLSAATGPDGRIYAIGGTEHNGGVGTATVEAYEPASGTWEAVAPLSVARRQHATVTAFDGRIYAFGGMNEEFVHTGVVEAYSASSDAWTTVASLPTPRGWLAGAAGPDGRIYAIGGFAFPLGQLRSMDTVEVYTPSLDAWRQAPPLPAGRHGLAAATEPNGRIFAIAGRQLGGPIPSTAAFTTPTDTWAPAASMSSARLFHAAATGLDGTIYALGGSGLFNSDSFLDSVEAYDPRSDSWSARARLPVPRRYLAAATGHDGRIYAIGGQVPGNNVSTNRVEAYTPSTNIWQAIDSMPTSRMVHAAVTGPDGRIYVIGGYDYGANTPLASMDAYDPVTNTWTSLSPMTFARAWLTAAVGADGRIYVAGGTAYDEDGNQVYLSSAEVYTPSTDTWEPVAPMPGPRVVASSATGADGRVYVMGGTDEINTEQPPALAYSPGADTWTAVGSPGVWRGYAAAAAGPNERIYVTGGATTSGVVSSVEAYTLPARTTTATLLSVTPAQAYESEPVTFAATVFPLSPNAGAVSGSVTFRAGPLAAGTVPLVGGRTEMTTEIDEPGSYLVTAAYSGGAQWRPSTSAPELLSVVLADREPPQTRFITGDNAVLVALPPAVQDSVRGTVSDGSYSGVDRVTVTFTPVMVGRPIVVNATLDCAEDHLFCAWSAAAPIFPGRYSVEALAADRFGNVESPGPAPIAIVVA